MEINENTSSTSIHDSVTPFDGIPLIFHDNPILIDSYAFIDLPYFIYMMKYSMMIFFVKSHVIPTEIHGSISHSDNLNDNATLMLVH